MHTRNSEFGLWNHISGILLLNCHLLAVWIRASYLASFCLSFTIWTVGVIVITSLIGVFSEPLYHAQQQGTLSKLCRRWSLSAGPCLILPLLFEGGFVSQDISSCGIRLVSRAPCSHGGKLDIAAACFQHYMVRQLWFSNFRPEFKTLIFILHCRCSQKPTRRNLAVPSCTVSSTAPVAQ